MTGQAQIPRPAPDRLAVAFARVLRGAGLEVPVGATLGFARALDCVGLATAGGVYWAGRATLVRRPDDIAAYDRAFEAFWGSAGPAAADGEEPPPTPTAAFDVDPEPDASEGGGPRGRPAVTVRWSPVETLRERDFASYTSAEFAQARRLMADLRLAGGQPAVASPAAFVAHPRSPRHSPDGPPLAACRGRSRAARVPHHGHAAATVGAAARRLRFDGAVRPCFRALRPRGRREPDSASRRSRSGRA